MSSRDAKKSCSQSRRVQRPHRFLLVDDDPLMLRSMSRLLRKAHPDWEIATAENGLEALGELATRGYDVLVTDLEMPNMGGLELLENVAQRHPEIMCVIHSSHAESFSNARARRYSRAILQKGVDAEEFVGTLDWALQLALDARRDSHSDAG